MICSGFALACAFLLLTRLKMFAQAQEAILEPAPQA
jgi:hypothetical protein